MECEVERRRRWEGRKVERGKSVGRKVGIRFKEEKVGKKKI